MYSRTFRFSVSAYNSTELSPVGNRGKLPTNEIGVRNLRTQTILQCDHPTLAFSFASDCWEFSIHVTCAAITGCSPGRDSFRRLKIRYGFTTLPTTLKKTKSHSFLTLFLVPHSSPFLYSSQRRPLSCSPKIDARRVNMRVCTLRLLRQKLFPWEVAFIVANSSFFRFPLTRD